MGVIPARIPALCLLLVGLAAARVSVLVGPGGCDVSDGKCETRNASAAHDIVVLEWNSANPAVHVRASSVPLHIVAHDAHCACRR